MHGIFFLAILAGFLTVLAPCILPLLPFLLGTSGTPGKTPDKSAFRPLMIIVGFVLSFSVLGAAFATAGSFLGISNGAFRNVAVALLLLFGLALLFESVYEKAMARLQPVLARWSRSVAGDSTRKTDAWSGILVGVSLGLVWTPCAGPILGSILALASRTADYVTTLLLMFAYALGAGVPMFFIAYGGQRLRARVLRAGRWQSALNKAFGLLIVIMAVLMFTGYDLVLQSRLIQYYPSGFETGGKASDDRSGSASRLPFLAPHMPPFSSGAWLNSAALTPETLKGKVVLIDFWTYSCINCIRTFPYLTAWQKQYEGEGFTVIGVHTPEFAFEKDENNVRRAMLRYGITYPVTLDNEYGTWNNYNNRYWPAHYLFDAKGRLRYTHFGEGEYDVTEANIRSLLAEAGAATEMPEAEVTGVTEVDFERIATPETYLGYARMEHLGSPEKVRRDEAAAYTAAAAPKRNDFYFDGTWRVEDERAVLVNAGGGIVYRYAASTANLVMGGGAAQGNVRAEVTLDGAPVPPRLRGSDIVEEDGKTWVTVSDERLYGLIDARGDYSEHTLRIRFEASGIEAYAFTFG